MRNIIGRAHRSLGDSWCLIYSEGKSLMGEVVFVGQEGGFKLMG
jgi:hypothetical protein